MFWLKIFCNNKDLSLKNKFSDRSRIANARSSEIVSCVALGPKYI